jgi:hypothetical protein
MIRSPKQLLGTRVAFFACRSWAQCRRVDKMPVTVRHREALGESARMSLPRSSPLRCRLGLLCDMLYLNKFWMVEVADCGPVHFNRCQDQAAVTPIARSASCVHLSCLLACHVHARKRLQMSLTSLSALAASTPNRLYKGWRTSPGGSSQALL